MSVTMEVIKGRFQIDDDEKCIVSSAPLFAYGILLSKYLQIEKK